MVNKKLTSYISIRANPSLRNKFIQKAKKYGVPSEVHRELLIAFIEDRLTISRPVNNKKECLYDE